MISEELTMQEAQVQIALITGLVTLLGILLTAIGAKLFTNPKTPKTDPDINRQEIPLSKYTGEQNDFIRLVMTDSEELHKKMDRLEKAVDDLRKERHRFLSAVGRYILKISMSWGTEDKMPFPDEADFSLLEETLPHNWRTTKN